MAATVFPTPVNDLATTLLSPRAIAASTLVLVAGGGAKILAALAELGYGAPSASQPIRVTVTKATYSARGDITVIQATGLSTDTLTGCTVVEGTPDQAFAAGDTVEVDPTAGMSDAYGKAINALENATTQASIAANRVYAGPGSGAAAAPTFRLIVAADMPVFVASGASHASGAVPDPGASAGTGKFLREDATWQVPPAGTPGGSSGQLEYNNAGAFGGTAAGTYATSGALFTFQALALGDVPVTIKGTTSQSANLTEWKDVNNNLTARVDTFGFGYFGAVSATGGNGFILGSLQGQWSNASFQLPSSCTMEWGQTNASNATKDVGIERQTANTLKINDGTTGSGATANLGRLNAKITTETGAGAPATTPADGSLYVDTTNSKLYVRTGGAWKSVTVA